jgi:nicotinamide-nucleotide amidase
MTGVEKTVETLARLAGEQDISVAAAESLTSGLIASRLGAGPDASTWFRGAVVAYQEPVKFDVLGVREGPLVTAECAEQMARGVRRLLGADVAVSVTGVGGPDSSEGEPPGTVYVAVTGAGDTVVRRLDIDGADPERILAETARHALELLVDTLERVEAGR